MNNKKTIKHKTYRQIKKYYTCLLIWRTNPSLFSKEQEYIDSLIEIFKEMFAETKIMKALVLDRMDENEVRQMYDLTHTQFMSIANNEVRPLETIVYDIEDKFFDKTFDT